MLRVKNLTIRKETKTILENVNFDLKEGNKILLVGPSGTGKSTFLKALLFFELGDSGEIYFNNKLITPTNINWYRSHFSYIGQKPPFFEGTVLQFIKFPFLFKANRKLKLKKEAVLKLFEQLTINQNLLYQDYSSLSGGEQCKETPNSANWVHCDI